MSDKYTEKGFKKYLNVKVIFLNDKTVTFRLTDSPIERMFEKRKSKLFDSTCTPSYSDTITTKWAKLDKTNEETKKLLEKAMIEDLSIDVLIKIYEMECVHHVFQKVWRIVEDYVEKVWIRKG